MGFMEDSPDPHYLSGPNPAQFTIGVWPIVLFWFTSNIKIGLGERPKFLIQPVHRKQSLSSYPPCLQMPFLKSHVKNRVRIPTDPFQMAPSWKEHPHQRYFKPQLSLPWCNRHFPCFSIFYGKKCSGQMLAFVEIWHDRLLHDWPVLPPISTQRGQ